MLLQPGQESIGIAGHVLTVEGQAKGTFHDTCFPSLLFRSNVDKFHT
jgi:hypothetical protein